MNLLSNAIKFTQEGKVELFVEMEEDGGDGEMQCLFRVIDTGIGIPKEVQATIFDSFVQADSTVTRNFGGTGLGTTISKELVEAMGGEIGVESEVGSGSQFWFRLPLERQPDVSKESIAATSFSDIRVLTLLSGELLPKIEVPLRRWGQEMEAAGSVPRLFSKMVEANEASRPYHVMIVESSMLGMSPSQFIETVRAENWLTDIALVLVDSSLDRSNLDSLVHAGYASVLDMPLNESILFNALHEVCVGRRLTEGVISVSDYHKKRTGRRSFNILVAEDNEVNQIVIRELLDRMGHHIEIVSDGESALDMLTERGRKFDMAILDMNMPNLSGLEVVKAFRFLEVEGHLPIIMLSANAMQESITECLDAGADDYLTKPIESNRLVTVIDRVGYRDEPEKGERSGVVQAFPASVDRSSREYIDEEPLEQLKQISASEGFVSKLIDQFKCSGEEQLAALEQAAAENNIFLVQDIAHGLKGSAGTVGAIVMYHLYSEMEGVSNQTPPGELLKRTNELAEMFKKTVMEFEDYLGRSPIS